METDGEYPEWLAAYRDPRAAELDDPEAYWSESKARIEADYRLQLELAALGACILDPKLLPETLAYLGPQSFANSCCRNIYHAMLKVEDLSLHSLCLCLTEQGNQDSWGGPGFLGLTVDGAPATITAAKKLSWIAAKEEYARNLRSAAEQVESGNALDLALLEAPRKEAEPLKIIDLLSLKKPEKSGIAWHIEKWIAQGDKIVLAGEPGVGKSFVALDLAISLATGTSWLDMNVQQHRVLYCDEENGSDVIGQRISMLVGPFRPDPTLDWLRVTHQNGVSFSNGSKWNALLGLIESFQPEIVVFDSLVRFHDLNENDNSEMARFFNQAIKPLSCGVLMLHHLNKPSQNYPGGASRIRGASDIVASYDGAWILERTGPGALVLQQMKNRHVPEEPPLHIGFFENDATGFRIGKARK